MSVIINGDTGITTPAETVQGALTTTGNTILGDATTDTLNVGNGGLVKNASGNVGIGTSSPTVKLDVSGVAKATALSISGTTAFSAGTISQDINWGMYFMAVAGASQAEFAWVNSASAERMRIDSSGNLLVGTTSTGFSNSWSASLRVASLGDLLINHPNTATSGTAYAQFGYNGAGIGSITQNGTTAVAYNTSSDYRLKENIAPMTGALATVSQLKPVTYSWKADGSDGQGFIAHELQAVVPDCVTGEKDAVDAEGKPVHQGIDTSFLVATLTAAIQEQQALITQLQADVATLKALKA
jgi:hypothetical protein